MPVVTYDEAKATLKALCIFTNEDGYVLASGPCIMATLGTPTLTHAELVRRLQTLESLKCVTSYEISRKGRSPQRIYKVITGTVDASSFNLEDRINALELENRDLRTRLANALGESDDVKE